MDKFLVNFQLKDIWSQDAQRRLASAAPPAPGSQGPTIRVACVTRLCAVPAQTKRLQSVFAQTVHDGLYCLICIQPH